MKTTLNILSELREIFLAGVPRDVAARAIEQNSWFSHSEIELAVRAIAEDMLREDLLKEWLTHYEIDGSTRCTLIVMAGNIPLVGFADLACCVAAGHRTLVKPSHKDRVLMEWVIEELRRIEPSIPIYIYNDGDHIDKLIATGGDAAVRYFKERYRDIPMLLRGSRHSMAIIDGDFEGLEEDIFSYSGLGCRNVSLLFVPHDFDLSTLPTSHANPKQRNSYLRQKALYTMSNVSFFDSSAHCITEQSDFPREVGELTVIRYRTIAEPLEWIARHDDDLQCIVANESTLTHPRRVDFGAAQHPTLLDYADGVDIMNFLLK